MNQDTRMAKLYRAGYSTREIAVRLGINRKTVEAHLRKNNVELRPPNNVKRSQWLKQAKTGGINYGQ